MSDVQVVEEWRVTGLPGDGYPAYEFVWSSDRYPDPEGAAKSFIRLHETAGNGWSEGPVLERRTVTRTPWRLA